MPGPAADSDSWKRLVLQSMAPPAWLDQEGLERRLVLSTRVRYMRNLRGRRFPHRAEASELIEVLSQIKSAARESLNLEVLSRPSGMERDFLVACRLVSPDFDWSAPGRAVLLDAGRTLSIMANEEDHLRIQALTPGWSLPQAMHFADTALEALGHSLKFARSDRFGFLAASPSNCGEGLRYSAMFHLIGLAHAKRLADVIRALSAHQVVVRGLFGERSRAVGAFVQISSTSASVPRFVGACEYLLEQEARARTGFSDLDISLKRQEAARFAESHQSLGLGDALRLLAWRRWPGASEAVEFRTIDGALPELALLESLGDPRAGRARAQLMRRLLSSSS